MIFLKIYTSGHISEISIPIFMKYLCNESCQSLCRQKNNAVEQIQLQVIETNQGFQIYIIYTMGATQRLCYNVGEYGDLNIGREIVHKKKNQQLKLGYVLYEIPEHNYSVCSKCFDKKKT